MIFLAIMLHLELLKSDQLMSRGRLCPMKNKIGLNLSENTFTVTEMESEEKKNDWDSQNVDIALIVFLRLQYGSWRELLCFWTLYKCQQSLRWCHITHERGEWKNASTLEGMGQKKCNQQIFDNYHGNKWKRKNTAIMPTIRKNKERQ